MLLEAPKHNDIVLGSDFTVCELCAAEKAQQERIMKAKAIRQLAGTFVGKYFLKIGETYLCEDCLSKAIAEIALKKKKAKGYKESVGDDIIESLNDEEDTIVEEEAPKKTTRGRKKAES